MPWYEPPTEDEHGHKILDYVLAQDAIVWVAQGSITDRSQELLGRTDIPIVFLRKQLEEQIVLGRHALAALTAQPPKRAAGFCGRGRRRSIATHLICQDHHKHGDE